MSTGCVSEGRPGPQGQRAAHGRRACRLRGPRSAQAAGEGRRGARASGPGRRGGAGRGGAKEGRVTPPLCAPLRVLCG